jgi:hypothetical protein
MHPLILMVRATIDDGVILRVHTGEASMRTWLGAVVVVALAAAARGDVVTYTVDPKLTTSGGVIDGPGVLPQFNPALGTLTGVTLFDRIDATAVGTWTNPTAGPLNASVQAYLHYNFIFNVSPRSGLANQSFVVLVGGQVDPGQTETFTNRVTGGDTVGANDNAPFVGTGTVPFDWQGAYRYVDTSSPGLTGGAGAGAAVTMGVTYTYTAAVPEPAAVVAPGLVTALGALAWAWRRLSPPPARP